MKNSQKKKTLVLCDSLQGTIYGFLLFFPLPNQKKQNVSHNPPPLIFKEVYKRGQSGKQLNRLTTLVHFFEYEW